MLPPSLSPQKPFYNQSTEIHATLKESLTAIEPHITFANGTANGFVPGRPVLDVPGWRERYTNTAASANSNYNAMSRLRIFAGTSNPVSLHSRPAGTTARAAASTFLQLPAAAAASWVVQRAPLLQPHVCVSNTPRRAGV